MTHSVYIDWESLSINVTILKMRWSWWRPRVNLFSHAVWPISIVLTKYESYKMTQIYNEESKNKGGIHEPLNRSEFFKGVHGRPIR